MVPMAEVKGAGVMDLVTGYDGPYTDHVLPSNHYAAQKHYLVPPLCGKRPVLPCGIGTVAGVRRILRSARAGDGEEERRDGTGSMPTQGDAARYQTADLATAAGSSRYDADPVAQGAADRDGMAGQPHA